MKSNVILEINSRSTRSDFNISKNINIVVKSFTVNTSSRGSHVEDDFEKKKSWSKFKIIFEYIMILMETWFRLRVMKLIWIQSECVCLYSQDVSIFHSEMNCDRYLFKSSDGIWIRWIGFYLQHVIAGVTMKKEEDTLKFVIAVIGETEKRLQKQNDNMSIHINNLRKHIENMKRDEYERKLISRVKAYLLS